ncbi:major facilitator superfamily domain-containing protein [Penicillium maclennaniae]|uniref:major facilitator superfamily domain-containing protein n=1 Tax=Penicillium maclennaniae TaxID=1343394 RepID=UPI00254078BF|nr:major facilitator superfamily domain-containing protein [Penicillium maclennaniae]KAJ5674817.1 major facilitator superfamily domain-containing protein [Penicillium maclennaniae]
MLYEIPTSSPKTYLTLSLKAIGFSTFQTTLLIIQVTVFASINLLLVTELTERIHQISLIGLLTQVWSLPLLIVLYTSAGNLTEWGLYDVTIVLLGWPSSTCCLGWMVFSNEQFGSDPSYQCCTVQSYHLVVGIASSNIYRSDDNPLYHRGNGQLVAIDVATILVYALAKCDDVARNNWKRRQWEGHISGDDLG